MRRIVYLLLFVLIAINGFSQQNTYSKFYYQRASLFEILPMCPDDIVFLGNSITNGNEWHELFGQSNIKNRGISGDCAKGVFDRLNPILKGHPKKIFLLIGINDLQRSTPPDTVIYWIRKVIEKVKKTSPCTSLYIQSIMPVNDTYRTFSNQITNDRAIQNTNVKIEQLCLSQNITYIDVFSKLKDEEGKLNSQYTNDGLHLLGKGYLQWKKILSPYLFDSPIVQIEHPIIPVLTHKEVNPVIRITVIRNHSKTDVLKKLIVALSKRTDIKDIQSLCIYQADTKGMPNENMPLSKKIVPSEENYFNIHIPINKDTITFWVTIKLNNKISLTDKIGATVTSLSTNKSELVLPESDSVPELRVGVAVRQFMQDNIHTSRIPGLITTNKGTLIAIYDGRRTSNKDLQGDIDICLNRSFDKGLTWEPMQVPLDRGKWGNLPEKYNGISDACILSDTKTGTIYIAGLWMHGVLDSKTGIWVEGLNEKSTVWSHQWKGLSTQPGIDEKRTCQFLITKSSDDGKTWCEPINITKEIKPEKWWLYAPAPGNGITMKNGILVFPTQGRDEKGTPFSNIMWSNNDGSTWKVSSPAATGTTECSVAELPDGDLMLNMRDNRNRENAIQNGRRISVTNNLGSTWSEHATSRKSLIEPTCMGNLHRHDYKGKSILLFSNPNDKTIRRNMTIKISFDNGNTWPEANQILLDEYKSAGYSCMTSIDEDLIGILYESSQAQLVFQQIPIKDFYSNVNQ